MKRKIITGIWALALITFNAFGMESAKRQMQTEPTMQEIKDMLAKLREEREAAKKLAGNDQESAEDVERARIIAQKEALIEADEQKLKLKEDEQAVAAKSAEVQPVVEKKSQAEPVEKVDAKIDLDVQQQDVEKVEQPVETSSFLSKTWNDVKNWWSMPKESVDSRVQPSDVVDAETKVETSVDQQNLTDNKLTQQVNDQVEAKRIEDQRIADEQAKVVAEQAAAQALRLQQEQEEQKAIEAKRIADEQEAKRIVEQQAAEAKRIEDQRIADEQAKVIAEQAAAQALRLQQEQEEQKAIEVKRIADEQEAKRIVEQQAAEAKRIEDQRIADEQAKVLAEQAAAQALRLQQEEEQKAIEAKRIEDQRIADEQKGQEESVVSSKETITFVQTQPEVVVKEPVAQVPVVQDENSSLDNKTATILPVITNLQEAQEFCKKAEQAFLNAKNAQEAAVALALYEQALIHVDVLTEPAKVDLVEKSEELSTMQNLQSFVGDNKVLVGGAALGLIGGAAYAYGLFEHPKLKASLEYLKQKFNFKNFFGKAANVDELKNSASTVKKAEKRK